MSALEPCCRSEFASAVAAANIQGDRIKFVRDSKNKKSASTSKSGAARLPQVHLLKIKIVIWLSNYYPATTTFLSNFGMLSNVDKDERVHKCLLDGKNCHKFDMSTRALTGFRSNNIHSYSQSESVSLTHSLTILSPSLQPKA